MRDKDRENFRMAVRLSFRLLPVQILLASSGAVNGIISSIFASNRIGSAAMSAMGLYWPISLAISAASTLLVCGSQIMCAEYMGKNETEKTEDIFCMDLFLSVLFSAVLILLLVLAVSTGITGVFTDTPEVRRYFDQYVLGMAVGILPQILGMQLASFLALENRGRRTTGATVSCIVANLIFNYLFIYKLHMEALGLALAGSLSFWVFFVVQAQYFLSPKAFLHFRLRKPSGADLKELIVIGAPGALSPAYLSVRGFIVNAVVMKYVGNAGISAFTATNNLLGIFWAIPAAMQTVSRILFGVSIGEEDRRTLEDVMRVMARCYLPIMCGVAAVLIACAVPFTNIYFRDISDPVYMMTVWGFRILPLCMPLSVICMHFASYTQAMGKQLYVHLLTLIDGVLAVSLFTAILVPHMGINGLYIANVLNGVVTTIYVILFAWIKNRRFPRTMGQMMMIPADFGFEEGAGLDITVRSMEEVMTVAEQVSAFCAERGVGERRTLLASLAVEEMAGNVISHGYTKDKKQHTADIRVVDNGDTLILRIKDDCVPFDPAERRDIMDPGDPAKNIGIRMIYNMAESIWYQNILGMNVLTIRV